jgi:hypothetical protein
MKPDRIPMHAEPATGETAEIGAARGGTDMYCNASMRVDIHEIKDR